MWAWVDFWEQPYKSHAYPFEWDPDVGSGAHWSQDQLVGRRLLALGTSLTEVVDFSYYSRPVETVMDLLQCVTWPQVTSQWVCMS